MQWCSTNVTFHIQIHTAIQKYLYLIYIPGVASYMEWTLTIHPQLIRPF